jgi:hypothetical protein
LRRIRQRNFCDRQRIRVVCGGGGVVMRTGCGKFIALMRSARPIVGEIALARIPYVRLLAAIVVRLAFA